MSRHEERNPILRPTAEQAIGDGGEDPAGVSLKVFADLAVNLGRVADRLDKEQARRVRFATSLHLLDGVVTQISTASTDHQNAEKLGPRNGKVWDVRAITCAGLTAGTVNVYKGPNAGGTASQNQRFTFLQAGEWEPGFLYLQAGQHLTFYSSSSFAGPVVIAVDGVEFDEYLLPDYLL